MRNLVVWRLHPIPHALTAGLGLCLLLSGPAMAQQGTPRLELGLLLPMMRLSEHAGADVGLGGRLTYNLTGHFALEGELDLFPRELFRTPRTPTVPMSTDRRIQALFGMKAGKRWESFGLFGKMRPGLVDFQNRLHVVCVTDPCPPLPSSQTEFAADLGAAFEFYLSHDLALRLDVGDLWIAGSGNDDVLGNDIGATGKLGHNFQWITGVSFRF